MANPPFAVLSYELPTNRQYTGYPCYHYSPYEGTPQKLFKSMLKRSKHPIKNYPQWFKDSKEFTAHEKRQGFIRGGFFYCPMYGLFVNGERFPYHLPHAKLQARIADLTPDVLAKGGKIDFRVTAFLEIPLEGVENDKL